MIVCPRCSKENQNHYKFCLGCGAELPRDAAQPKSFTAPTPPAGTPVAAPAAAAQPAPVAAPQPAPAAQFGGAAAPAFGGAPVMGAGVAVAEPPAPAANVAPVASAPEAASETVTCPQCGRVNPRNFKFCGSCGYNLQDAAQAPTATGAPSPSAAAVGAQAVLVLIRPDGTEGESFPLVEGATSVGRSTPGPFSTDAYLSPHHATFVFDGKILRIKDEGSLNGVFVRIDHETPYEIEDGSIFRVGQEILRFERLPEPKEAEGGVEIMGSPNAGYLGRVCLVTGRTTDGNAFCVPATGLHMGRERGDVIFPDDGYVSGLHCRIHGEGGSIYLTDVGSSNGTFVRVPGEATVAHGALLLMGQQLFRVDLG